MFLDADGATEITDMERLEKAIDIIAPDHVSIYYLSIYLCIYVCIYVCMYACMYVCMYVCMHVRISIYLVSIYLSIYLSAIPVTVILFY